MQTNSAPPRISAEVISESPYPVKPKNASNETDPGHKKSSSEFLVRQSVQKTNICVCVCETEEEWRRQIKQKDMKKIRVQCETVSLKRIRLLTVCAERKLPRIKRIAMSLTRTAPSASLNRARDYHQRELGCGIERERRMCLMIQNSPTYMGIYRCRETCALLFSIINYH